MAKHVGKFPTKCNEIMNERVKDDVPKATNYNQRKSNNLKIYEKMKNNVDELESMYPLRKSVGYELLDELDMLLFTLVDEGTKVPEMIIDGCIDRKENEYART